MSNKPKIDKLELDKKLDFYLINDIPLSFLLDTYDITYRQMELVLSKVRGFQRQVDRLSEMTDKFSYNEVPERYLVTAHNLPEDQPFLTKEEEHEAFKRLEEIKLELEKYSQVNVLEARFKVAKIQKKIAAYNKDDLKTAEEFIRKYDAIKKSKNNITESEVLELLNSLGLSYQECQRLNEVYSSFLEDQNSFVVAKEELRRQEAQLASKNRLEEEYDSIRSKIVLSYVKFVNWTLRKTFNNIPLDKEELQMYGMEGLLKAMTSYDYKLGNRLDTYAFDAIVHNVQRHFKELTGLEWGVYIKKDSIRYYRELIREMNGNSITPSPQEVADLGLISLSARAIENIDQINESIIPLSSVRDDFEDEYPETLQHQMPITMEDYEKIDKYIDANEAGVNYNIENLAIRSLIRDGILQVLDTLTEREKQVLILRYGLLDGECKTFEEVGNIFNLTRERIRQIELKALRKLKYPWRAKQLKEYMEVYDTDTETFAQSI